MRERERHRERERESQRERESERERKSCVYVGTGQLHGQFLDHRSLYLLTTSRAAAHQNIIRLITYPCFSSFFSDTNIHPVLWKHCFCTLLEHLERHNLHNIFSLRLVHFSLQREQCFARFCFRSEKCPILLVYCIFFVVEQN